MQIREHSSLFHAMVLVVLAAATVIATPSARAAGGTGYTKPLSPEIASELVGTLLGELYANFEDSGFGFNLPDFIALRNSFAQEIQNAYLLEDGNRAVRKVLQIGKRYEKLGRKTHALFTREAVKGEKRVRKILRKYEADPDIVEELEFEVALYLQEVDSDRDGYSAYVGRVVGDAIDAIEARM